MQMSKVRNEREALTVMHYSSEQRTREAAALASFAKPAPVRTRRPRRSMYADGILRMLADVRSAAAFFGL